MDLIKLRKIIKNKNIIWNKHSFERMLEREIYRKDVIEALLNGEVIKDYADDKPFPSALILGFTNKKSLHIVIALDEGNQNCYVITAYYPDLKHFENDYKTRKK